MNGAAATRQQPSGEQRSVLLIDNDRDIADVVRAILVDEGYSVSIVSEVTPDAIAAAIGALEPDVVLLDGETGSIDYGSSWVEAAKLSARGRRVPVIMFTAHSSVAEEARDRQSTRAAAAGFAAVVTKPFDLDELLAAVADAVGNSIPFDGSSAADESRSAALAREIETIGGQDIRPSARREWVTFRTPAGRLMQIYWWQTGGSYLVGRYDTDGRRMENIALTYERAGAIQTTAALLRAEREA